MKTRTAYRVGIIGNSCTHGELVAMSLRDEPDADIVAAYVDEPVRAAGLQDLLGLELSDAADRLLDADDIDVVAIATSPHTKADWVERSVRAGKHVLLNKPFAESLASARRIEAAVADGDVEFVFDIPAIARFHPMTAKVLDDVRAGVYGRPLNHMHSWSMTFSEDFPLAEVWPERLDPPHRSGGGEMTNMGSYAVDFMVGLWGRPRSVQARSRSYWPPYERVGVENFGQVVADYGDFYAVLSTGKQTLATLPSLDVAEALDPRYWHNVLELQFEHHNLTIRPFHDVLVHNGEEISTTEYLDGYEFRTPFRQLVDAIEKGRPVDSDAASGRLGVEVLMAAYSSTLQDGAVVGLPLAEGANPLVAN